MTERMTWGEILFILLVASVAGYHDLTAEPQLCAYCSNENKQCIKPDEKRTLCGYQIVQSPLTNEWMAVGNASTQTKNYRMHQHIADMINQSLHQQK